MVDCFSRLSERVKFRKQGEKGKSWCGVYISPPTLERAAIYNFLTALHEVQVVVCKN